jgi:O-antigen ligase
MVFCALVDLPIRLKIAGTSGLGAGTFAAAGLVWALFLIRPVLPGYVLKSLLFLILFEIYSAGTMFWSGTGIDGVQLLVVGIAFLGLIVVCARETAMNPANGLLILRMLLIATSIGVAMYWYVAYTEPKLGEGADDLINPRPFALFALTVVAAALACWRGPHRSKMASVLPLAWAAITTFTVGLSMSRTALVCCAALFPLAILLRLNFKSFMQALSLLVVGGALFVVAVFSYQPLYDRFFAGDVAIHAGGYTFNASGRTRIWDVLLRGIGDDWVFGKGVASSEVLVRRTFKDLIVQPHNDYLRFYFDTGIVGLALWLCFAGAFYSRTIANLRRSLRDGSADYPLHVAGLLAFSAVSWSMLTDNSVCYSFVMMPLAMVMGCSLGADGSVAMPVISDPQGFEAVFPEQLPQAIPRKIRSVS